MSVKAARTTGRDRSGDRKYLASLVRDGHATDLDDAKHVAKLVERGVLQLGKPGPALAELLRPGPKIPGVLRALRADRRSR